MNKSTENEETEKAPGVPVSPVLRLLAAAGILAVAAGAVLAYYIDPMNPPRFMPECFFYAATGWYCPGCGMMRATHAMATGNVGAAVGFNALGALVGVPVGGYLMVSLVSIVVRGRALPSPVIGARAAYAIIAVLVLFWILRNIPVYPFTFLAP